MLLLYLITDWFVVRSFFRVSLVPISVWTRESWKLVSRYFRISRWALSLFLSHLNFLFPPQHPFILSPVYASFNGTGLMTVRQFFPSGSLRDAIYGQAPQANLLQKYGGSSGRRVMALPPGKIAKYGRHVLEAMRFLFEKGYVLGMWHNYNYRS